MWFIGDIAVRYLPKNAAPKEQPTNFVVSGKVIFQPLFLHLRNKTTGVFQISSSSSISKSARLKLAMSPLRVKLIQYRGFPYRMTHFINFNSSQKLESPKQYVMLIKSQPSFRTFLPSVIALSGFFIV